MDINDLCGIGKVIKTLEPIQGLTVTYSTLSAQEELEIENNLLNDYGEKYTYIALKIESLSYSIKSINNKTFSNRDEFKTFLKSLHISVIDTLYSNALEVEQSANILETKNSNQARAFWKYCKIFKIRPSQVKKVPKSELLWAFFHIQEDEHELIEIAQSLTEQLIAAINPELYQKINKKKNEVQQESSEFEEELKRVGISKEVYDNVDVEKRESFDEGLDIIGTPINL